MRIKLQLLRAGTPYQSYRIALPKALIEAKHWHETDFTLEDHGQYLVLKPYKEGG